jgi:hypothetical protein
MLLKKITLCAALLFASSAALAELTIVVNPANSNDLDAKKV